jgi:protein-S-isoprenylcysteine O-methyltransferase Ste14
MEALKYIRAIFLLPFMVTAVIPWIIMYRTRAIDVGWSLAPPFNVGPLLWGVVLIFIGLVLLTKTISLFARIGEGTLAPWDPTQKLVVHGVYRYVRNPMISGVLCILLGEAILFGSIFLFYWFIFFLTVNVIYMPLFEEPSLERRFGEEYIVYKRHVPRWIPRSKPWRRPNGDN